jgi:hypothetical protein
MFQKDIYEDQFFYELRELCTKAQNDGWNVVKLNANLIDLNSILEQMEKDRAERISQLIGEQL